MTFKEFLNEMPNAVNGDAFNIDLKAKLEHISTEEMKKMTHVGQILGIQKMLFDIYVDKTNTFKAVANFKDGSAYLYATASLKPFRELKNKKAFQVYSIKNMGSEQGGKGLGTQMYEFLILKMGYTVVSDESQYDGARKAYKRLSDNSKIKLQLFDTYENKIVNDNLKIKNANDTNVWFVRGKSTDLDKKDVVIIASKI